MSTDRSCAGVPGWPASLWWLSLTGSAPLVVAPALLGPSTLSSLLYVSVSLGAVLALIAGSLLWRPRPVLPWILLAVGQSAYAVGDIGMLVQPDLLDTTLVAVSVGDLAWLVAPALVLAGLVVMLRAQAAAVDRLALLDASVAGVVVLLLTWVYLVAPAALSTDGVLALLLATGYPALNVLAVAPALYLTRRRAQGSSTSASLLLGSVLANLLGVVLLCRMLVHHQEPSVLMTLSWQVAYALMAAAALHPSMRRSTQHDLPAAGAATRSRLPLLVMLAALAPMLGVVESLRHPTRSQPVVAVAALAVFVLVLLRAASVQNLLAAASRRLLLEQAEQRFSALMRASSDLILILDGGMVEYATPSVSRRLRLTAPVMGRPLADLMDASDVERVEVHARTVAGRGRQQYGELEPAPALYCTLRTTSGEAVPVEVLCTRLDGEALDAVVLTMRDVGERQRMEHELRRLAYTDALTGLANRTLLRERLRQHLEQSSTHGALLMLDLDDFKIVNDLYGHAHGDALLVETTRRLRLVTSEFDGALVARLGGDEFALLLPDIGSAEARWVCASLLNRLRQPVAVGGSQVEVGTSIGLVALEEGRRDVDEALRDADLAMYAAKAAGKNAWALFEQSMHRELLDRLTLEAELHAALEAEQLELHYQPLQSLHERRTIAAEALVRWRHPTRGLVPPDRFIGVAERSPLILRVGAWVLLTACRQLVAWTDELGPSAPLEIGVNVSPRQLLDPHFPDVVAQVLAETGLRPSRLVLEITESTVMDLELTAKQLTGLRALGVQLSIDDFGTGHSSLARLEHLPVDNLKIDRSFVGAINADGGAPLLRAMVDMAHTLGLSVTAEGIETEPQLEHLRQLGCDRGQGYLLSRPMPAEALREHLLSAGAGPLVPAQRGSRSADPSCATGTAPSTAPR